MIKLCAFFMDCVGELNPREDWADPEADDARGLDEGCGDRPSSLFDLDVPAAPGGGSADVDGGREELPKSSGDPGGDIDATEEPTDSGLEIFQSSGGSCGAGDVGDRGLGLPCPADASNDDDRDDCWKLNGGSFGAWDDVDAVGIGGGVSEDFSLLSLLMDIMDFSRFIS